MKTNRVSGLACMFTVVVIAACSGTQETAVVEPDGAVFDGPNVFPSSGESTGGNSTGLESGISVNTGVPTSSGAVTGTGQASSGPPASSAAGSSGGGGGVCPSTCATNADCQSGCPAISGALNCCDSVTMACFQSASSSCPGGTSSGGGGADSGGGGGY